MAAITRDDFERVLARFYGFSDSVIRSVLLEYGEDGKRIVSLEIACRDAESTANEGWVSVRIRMQNVQDFTVRESPQTTLQVLSDGLHIQPMGAGVAIEFGGATEPPQTKGELQKSDGYAIGSEIEMEVGPY